MRTVGTAVRSCQTRSEEKVIVLAGWIEVAKFFLDRDDVTLAYNLKESSYNLE